ncbi:arylesterase [Echinicola jeungdonensis]|uniref:Arylesterase n=1 Tax=Echinicola jeungdonensis TaxID=709343 RepID=A0ABV5JAF1_9BACT|nr:arylesterase [Echinicola jeungdonensis]MDN3669421.1 arylesterase [Echinicola jeungdonensis]
MEVKKKTSSQKTILFFGNSITAGFGIDKEKAFVGLIKSRIDSLGLGYEVINGGLSGETTASGLNRIDWFLEEKPDIFVLELGANDGLRGIKLSETKKNLEGIIESVREKYPDTKIILAGMQIPPNMGKEYTSTFKTIFPQIAEEKEVTLIPFLLDGVAGNPDLNQDDGIHPNIEGHQIIAQTVWEYLQPLL